jgi:single-strand DNA-binding protein
MFNVTLIGHLGADAEPRVTRNNSTLTVLSLATKRTWKNRQTGERESQITWHRCICFGRTAEYAAALTKRAHLQIVGEIQTREYIAKDGAKKSVTEIRVHRIVRLDRGAKAESTEGAAA